jgi:FkbM family methyltransferase
VLAVDPDEANQEILKEKFLTYRVVSKPVTIVGKAVSDENKSEALWIDGPGSALNTLSRKWVDTFRGGPQRSPNALDRQEVQRSKQVETTTLEELIALHGAPFFIKIDVERHEVPVLKGWHRPVSYLSFEVNLPEFQAEGLECVELLRRLAPEGKFNYASGNECRLMMDDWASAAEFLASSSNVPRQVWKCIGKRSLPPELDD